MLKYSVVVPLRAALFFGKMREVQPLSTKEISTHFTRDRGWTIVEKPLEEFDAHQTVAGSKLRCIDKNNGMTPEGYHPETIELGPSWLGAADGIAAFKEGNAEDRMRAGVADIEASGFVAVVHGHYLRKKRGCAFREALIGKLIPELSPMTREEWELICKKLGIHYTELYDSVNPNLGFAVNTKAKTTILPEGGKYYPVDLWFAENLGIKRERALSAIAKCGELILPADHRTLFVCRH